MRKLPFIILLFSFSFLLSKTVEGATLTQVSVKLDRLKSNTSLSGTVCVTPSSAGAGTEDKISITFPSDFTINSSTSNWETDISDLPAGSTAWPGISSNASAVSGKTVTFDSNDLTNSSANYCFNFSSSSSSTGSTGSKTGNIVTRNSSNTEIDSQQYAISIINNDQIQVSATVPANTSDYFIDLTRVDPPLESTVISEDFESTYQIIYGTYLPYPTSITVQATWSLGTIENQSSPTVELLEYVVGTADDAYGNTPPVIDTVNRTVTWEINSFPGNQTDEKLRFKLRTLHVDPDSRKVNFTVSSKIDFPGGETLPSSLTSVYKHTVPKPLNLTPTPTPIPVPKPPVIEKLGVTEITQDSATIFMWTDTDTSKVIIFGTDIHMQDKKSVRVGSSKGANIKITGLKPSTKYYYKAYAIDKLGKETSSDIYAFTTANPSTPLAINPLSLVVTSGNTILTSLGDEKNDILVIPVNSPFQFKFALLDKISANLVRADLRDKKILGLFSLSNNAIADNGDSTSLIETEKGVYSGTLSTSEKPGNYLIFVKVLDNNGNLSDQQLAEIKTIKKFRAISNNNNKPIEGARVFLYIYNPTSKTYQVVPSNLVKNGNPQLTDRNGELDLVLPVGQYKADVSDLRHKSKTVAFVINPNDNQNFPEVKLENTGLNPLNIFGYYKNVVNEVFIYNTELYSKSLTGSPRFFDLVSMFSLAGIIILTIYAFSKRHRIPVSYIPSYFYYLVDRKSRNEKYIHGVIYDENDKPIPGANVYLTDKAEEKIVGTTKTNKYGEFYFRKGKSEYLLMAMAKNYKTSPLFEYREREHLKFKINLTKEAEGINLSGRIIHYFTHLMGMSFEVLLIGSFIFELLFLNSFGVAKTLPFLIISVFNLTLWILHSHNKSHSKNIF